MCYQWLEDKEHILPRSNDKGLSHQYAKLLHILCDAWFEHMYQGAGGCAHAHAEGWEHHIKMGIGVPCDAPAVTFAPLTNFSWCTATWENSVFLSAMCFMSPISGDPFKSKYFARGPSTHKSLTFRLNTVVSFWNDLSAFVLLLLLLVKARKVLF